MLNSLWRLVGWLLLPAALIFALVVFSPFAMAFATWGLLHPELVLTLIFIVLAMHYVRAGARALATLYDLATRKRRQRREVEALALQAVQRAVAR